MFIYSIDSGIRLQGDGVVAAGTKSAIVLQNDVVGMARQRAPQPDPAFAG
jgi:hypothetical protein